MTSETDYGRRFWRRRLSRRGVLKRAALGGTALAAATIVGCGEEGGPTRPVTAPEATTEAERPRRGGILARVGGRHDFLTRGRPMDPHTEAVSVAQTLRFVHQALMGYNLRTYDVETDLAESWEQPSPSEYIFKLPSGVKWQNKPPANGRELSAEDVVFSLNRVRTNQPRFQHRSLLLSLEKVEAVNKGTVRITTNPPDASVLAALGSDGVLVMNPETVARADKFQGVEEVVGSGAFILKERQESVNSEYIRNPDYYKRDLPYLDSVNLPFIEDPLAAYAAILAGKVDIAPVPGTKAKEVIDRRGSELAAEWAKVDFILLMSPQMERPLFRDRRVARALRLLADHNEFITAYAQPEYGRGRHGSIFPISLESWDLAEEEYKKSIFWRQPKDAAVKEALDLLRAAGFGRENPLNIEISLLRSPTINPGAELLSAQWRQNSQGVVQPAALKPLDAVAWSRARVRGEFEYAFYPITMAALDPGPALDQMYRTGGSLNYAKLSDPKLDALTDKQRAIFKIEERRAAVKEIVRYMMEDSPLVAAVVPSPLIATKPKVRGYAPDQIVNGRVYQWVWLAQ